MPARDTLLNNLKRSRKGGYKQNTSRAKASGLACHEKRDESCIQAVWVYGTVGQSLKAAIRSLEVRTAKKGRIDVVVATLKPGLPGPLVHMAVACVSYIGGVGTRDSGPMSLQSAV